MKSQEAGVHRFGVVLPQNSFYFSKKMNCSDTKTTDKSRLCRNPIDWCCDLFLNHCAASGNPHRRMYLRRVSLEATSLLLASGH